MTDLLSRAANWLIAPREGQRDEATAPSKRVWLAPSDRSGGPECTRHDEGRRESPPVPATRLVGPGDAVPAPATRIAVVGPADDVPAVASSIGLVLRARMRASAALILLWEASPSDRGVVPLGPPGLPGARLLAGRLARRDLPARAHGRLVWLVLPAAVEEAEAAALRAEAAANGVPSVLAVMAPRGREADRLIADRGVAVVAMDPESRTARIAVAELAALGVAAAAVAPAPPGPARLVALAGLRPHVPRSALPGARDPRDPRGQAAVLLVAAIAAIMVGVVVLGAAARGVAREGGVQRAADLAALAGARAMRAAYPRLFEPAVLDGRPDPRHLEKDDYVALGREAAERTARANGIDDPAVAFPDADSFAPIRIRVDARVEVEVRRGGVRRRLATEATAVAELAPPGADGLPVGASGSGYDGPLAYRQGKPMRPDVAQAFDRLERAARADGIALVINSALRTDAEQAVLWAQHPDPKWVAPPGTSLHRYGTELDLGPPSAYAWLAANAPRFHFIRRYENEPWHFGYALNARSTPRTAGGDGSAARGMPSFVPPQYAPILARAAQRWNVSATLLAAQLYVESNFNPFAISPAGARGIAQLMPGTAAGLGVGDPFDVEQAIDGQAHLMRDLLRRFASVPLALAAYNAGPLPVAACGCVPDYPETRAYVVRILGLMGGAGDPVLVGASGLAVRLVQ